MRICLISPGHLSTNPRLTKEADALAEVGHEVTVVAADYLPWGRAADQTFAGRSWRRAPPTPFGPGAPGPRRVVQVGRHRAARRAFAVGSRADPVLAAACHQASPDLAAAASRIPADLYVAHYIAALPAAAAAARRHRALYAFDAEDFHTGERPQGAHPDRPLIEAIERRHLPGCAYMTAASPGIADAYAQAYRLPRPVVILNVFPRDQAPAAPTAAGEANPGPSLYWFSQSIGPGRGLKNALRAIARARTAPHLYVRGTPSAGYEAVLREVARRLEIGERLHILPPAAPDDMVRLAAAYDLGLAGEGENSLNHRITLANKLFTYLLAGVPTLMSDIEAHRRIAPDLGAAALQFRTDDPQALADALDAVLGDAAGLAAARAAAFDLGQSRFNWDLEKHKLLDLVRSVATDTTA